MGHKPILLAKISIQCQKCTYSVPKYINFKCLHEITTVNRTYIIKCLPYPTYN